MLKSSKGFYRRRNKWTNDPQQATVWTQLTGASAAKGHCYPKPDDMEIVSFEIKLPESISKPIDLS